MKAPWRVGISLPIQWDAIEWRIREFPRPTPTLRLYCSAANRLYADRSDTLYFIATTWPGEPDPDANVILKRCALGVAAWIQKGWPRSGQAARPGLTFTSRLRMSPRRRRAWPDDRAA